MSDITKCNGKECPHKETCYRFTAAANEFRQSWFMGTPFTMEGDSIKCNSYWGPNREEVWLKKEKE
jgi:hypothetical protein